MLDSFHAIKCRQVTYASEALMQRFLSADVGMSLHISVPVMLQVILILTKLYDFNLGAVTESSLWRYGCFQSLLSPIQTERLQHHGGNFIKMQKQDPKNNKRNVFMEDAVYCKFDL